MNKPIPAQPFGQTPDFHEAVLHTIESELLTVRITDYGGRIVAIEAPDRDGRRGDVVLGFDTVTEYAQADGAFGALLGRNANRIAGGRFAIDGRTYQLPTNDRGATLHGGPAGFDTRFWHLTGASREELALELLSPDGDQGFPGELSVVAVYRLAGDSLWLEFSAQTTQPTVLSLSAHPYFNLAGAASGDVLGHEVTIAADAFVPTGPTQIPTGEIRGVEGTLFDFRKGKTLGSGIRQADEQLVHGQGYDHSFVLGMAARVQPIFAARIREPTSGRVLEVHTTQPAMQLYAGNQLDGTVVGRGGVIYRQSAGLALEPQGFPDAPNHANFPTTVLRPGDVYRAAIRYRFTVD